MNYKIESLNIKHLPQLNKFKCGNPSMEGFLFEEAYKHHVNGEGITKVVTVDNSKEIIAYFTLKCDALKIVEPEMHLFPRYIPCIEIARIAVKSNWQRGQKSIHLGTDLMGYIITLIKDDIGTKTGCRFITLHAVLDKVNWYEREFKFRKLADERAEIKDEETEYMSLDITDDDKKKELYEYTQRPQ